MVKERHMDLTNDCYRERITRRLLSDSIETSALDVSNLYIFHRTIKARDDKTRLTLPLLLISDQCLYNIPDNVTLMCFLVEQA